MLIDLARSSASISIIFYLRYEIKLGNIILIGILFIKILLFSFPKLYFFLKLVIQNIFDPIIYFCEIYIPLTGTSQPFSILKIVIFLNICVLSYQLFIGSCTATSTIHQNLQQLSFPLNLIFYLLSTFTPSILTVLYFNFGIGQGFQIKSTPTTLTPGQRYVYNNLIFLISYQYGSYKYEASSEGYDVVIKGRHLVVLLTTSNFIFQGFVYYGQFLQIQYISWSIYKSAVFLMYYKDSNYCIYSKKMNNEKSAYSYHAEEKLELHPLVNALVGLSLHKEPYFPVGLTRKIGEQHGVNLNQEILCKMLGHICDEELDNLMKGILSAKNSKTNRTLTKAEVQKSLLSQNFFSTKPSVYPLYQPEESSSSSLQEMNQQ